MSLEAKREWLKAARYRLVWQLIGFWAGAALGALLSHGLFSAFGWAGWMLLAGDLVLGIASYKEREMALRWHLRALCDYRCSTRH